MREVILRVRHRGAPESDISASHPSVQLRSVSSMTGSADRRHRLIEIGGPPTDVADFLDEFSDAEAVLSAEPVSPLDISPVLVSLTFNSNKWDSISEQLREFGVLYRTGTTIVAGWERWTIYLEDEATLRNVIDHLEAAGNDVDLVRDVSVEEIESASQLEISSLIATLTERQQEVLTTAINAGYYQANADATVESIADDLGISPSTAWEHLQRAEEKVMNEVSIQLGEYDDSAS